MYLCHLTRTEQTSYPSTNETIMPNWRTHIRFPQLTLDKNEVNSVRHLLVKLLDCNDKYYIDNKANLFRCREFKTGLISYENFALAEKYTTTPTTTNRSSKTKIAHIQALKESQTLSPSFILFSFSRCWDSIFSILCCVSSMSFFSLVKNSPWMLLTVSIDWSSSWTVNFFPLSDSKSYRVSSNVHSITIEVSIIEFSWSSRSAEAWITVTWSSSRAQITLRSWSSCLSRFVVSSLSSSWSGHALGWCWSCFRNRCLFLEDLEDRHWRDYYQQTTSTFWEYWEKRPKRFWGFCGAPVCQNVTKRKMNPRTES